MGTMWLYPLYKPYITGGRIRGCLPLIGGRDYFQWTANLFIRVRGVFSRQRPGTFDPKPQTLDPKP